MKHPVLTRAVAALAALPLLAACGGDADPVESSTSTETARVPSTSGASEGSSTAGSEGQATEVPAAAKKRTTEGAGEFAKFYSEQVGQAFHTGDTSWLKAYSDDACVLCTQWVTETNDRYSNNGVKADRNPISASVLSSEKSQDGAYRVRVQVKVEGYNNVDAKGAAKRKVGSTGEMAYKLAWTDGGWRTQQAAQVL